MFRLLFSGNLCETYCHPHYGIDPLVFSNQRESKFNLNWLIFFLQLGSLGMIILTITALVTDNLFKGKLIYLNCPPIITEWCVCTNTVLTIQISRTWRKTWPYSLFHLWAPVSTSLLQWYYWLQSIRVDPMEPFPGSSCPYMWSSHVWSFLSS